MADRHLTVTLDRPRTLRLTVPALREVKRRAGRGLGELLIAVGTLDLDAIVWILWAAARGEDPKLTDDAMAQAVQDYLDAGHTVDDLVDLVEELAERAGLLKPADPPPAPGETETPAGPTTPEASPSSTPGSKSSTETPSGS